MIETVVVTNNKKITTLAREMNIRGNVLIAQQLPLETETLKVKREGPMRSVISNSKGIGLNRSIALHYSQGDICVLADDDMVFFDDYLDTVKKAYEELSDADVIIFDLDGKNLSDSDREKPRRVRWYNYMRFGAARFTFRRISVLKQGINFNRYFGASVFGSGEDTLFLKDCLDKKLKVYYYPQSLAKLSDKRESTWFKGFDLNYYFDKGALYYAISPYFYKILLLRHIIKTKNKRMKPLSSLEVYESGLKGAQFFSDLENHHTENLQY